MVASEYGASHLITSVYQMENLTFEDYRFAQIHTLLFSATDCLTDNGDKLIPPPIKDFIGFVVPSFNVQCSRYYYLLHTLQSWVHIQSADRNRCRGICR